MSRKQIYAIFLIVILNLVIIPSYIQINDQKGRKNPINPSPAAFHTGTTPESSDPTQDEWPMFRGQLNHTGLAHTTPVVGTNPVWNYTTGNTVRASPVVADGRVYVGSNSLIICLNANTGGRLWAFATGEYGASSAAVADGRVYVGSYNHKVYCRNANTGGRLWNYTTGDIVQSSPAVSDGRVFVGSWDRKVYCLNANTGGLIWNYTTGNYVKSSPAVANGRVYIGSDDNKVYCLNATTGGLLWNYTTGNAVYSSPAVAGGRVYVGSYDKKVYCLNATTGGLLWNYTTGSFVYSSPAVAGGWVYVGSYDKKVYCLNATTGGLLWNYTTGKYVESSPAVANGRVYIGSDDKKVYCLNATTGELLWNYATGSPVDSSPAVANGRVYIGSNDNKVYCLNALTIPAAPLQLQAIAGIGQITLKWSTPSFDGGLAITNYKIYRGISSGTEIHLMSIDSMLNYTDTGLSNGTIYYYKVSAVNGAGEGPLSNETSASNYRAPQILASRVTPDTGNQDTLFIFSLIYKQSDNRQPSFINLLLNETKFGMNKRDVSDNNYVTGVFYQYLTYLPPGTYIYSFECNDSVSYNSTELEILVVTPTMNSNAQLLWAKIWGSQQNDVLKGVTVDSNGSIYCVGGSRGYLVLTKFFSNGTMAWENTNSTPEENIGVNSYDYYDYDHNGVAVDASGSIYCVGTRDGLLLGVKFFSNGSKAWEFTANAGSFTYGYGLGVAVDNMGFIYYIGGGYSSMGMSSTLLIKVFSNGTKVWEKRWSNGIPGKGVAVDSAGFIYYTWDTYEIYNGDSALYKVSPNGTCIWFKGIDSFASRGISVDCNNYIYCVGDQPGLGGRDLGLIKFFPNGTKVWQTAWGSPYEDFGVGVALAANGFIYCMGSTGNISNLALIKFFSNGTLAWQTIWNDSQQSYGYGVALDSQAAIYCIGYTFINTSNSDFLLLKYIEADPNLPSTTILEPSNDASLSGVKIWINGTAFAGASHVFQNILINDTRFTNATNLIGENSGAFGFYNCSNIPDGLLRINVTGVNEVGQKGIGIVCFTLDNTPPSTASLSSPAEGSWVKGTIWINATAADATSGIKNVTFYRDVGVLIGTSIIAPFIVTWNTSGLDGAHTLYVRAFDNAGNYLDSATVAITVDNTPPSTALITSPIGSAQIKGTISITANAADAIGVNNVTFYLDAIGGTVIGTDTSFPYSITWDTLMTTDGTHTLHVRTFDRAGNYLDSATVAITVDNTAPTTASISSPPPGAYLKSSIPITATAADAGSGVKNITFYLDTVGGTVIGVDPTFPFAVQWNTSGLDGAHLLYIRVFDIAGNYLDSGGTLVTVDNMPPTTATITSPSSGAYVKGTTVITAIAADNPGGSGAGNVTFYRDAAVLLGTDTASPYTYSWNTATTSDGVHTLYVRVFDMTGNYRDSATVPVTVNNTFPIATAPTAPQNLQATPGNRYINLTWQTPSSDGGSSITNYRIYRGMSPGNESLLTTIGAALIYIDDNLINGRTYYYQISAINGIGEGNLSIEVHAKPAAKPCAPHNISITVIKGKIIISWQAPSDNGGDTIISYIIYRGISSDNETYFITLGNISSFTDTNLVHGRAYYYRVSAVNELGESSWSAEVSGLAYISGDGTQNSGWIIIIILMVGLVGLSGGILYFNRTTNSTAGKSIGLPKAPIGQKGSKFWKYISTGVVEVEDGSLPEMGPHSLWNSLRLRFSRLYKSEKWAQALVLLGTLNEIAEFLGDDEKIKEMSVKYEEIRWRQHNLSEMGPESFWNSLMLRFNRLYKLEKWAQALTLLRTLNEIAEFLGDNNKYKRIAVKYDEIQGKQQQKVSENQIN